MLIKENINAIINECLITETKLAEQSAYWIKGEFHLTVKNGGDHRACAAGETLESLVDIWKL